MLSPSFLIGDGHRLNCAEMIILFKLDFWFHKNNWLNSLCNQVNNTLLIGNVAK